MLITGIDSLFSMRLNHGMVIIGLKQLDQKIQEMKNRYQEGRITGQKVLWSYGMIIQPGSFIWSTNRGEGGAQ